MQIILGAGVTQPETLIVNSPVFKDWAARQGAEWQGTITISDIDFWGGEVHSLQVTIKGDDDPWPSKILLRSETVDVLVIVTDGERRYVIFVEQYRPALGAQVISNVAGGVNWSEPPLIAAERETIEELGLQQGTRVTYKLLLLSSVLVTPGATNERVYLTTATIKVFSYELDFFVEHFRGKLTGVEAEGERIVTHVVAAEEARAFILAQPHPDSKTLLSLSFAGL